MNRGVNIKIYFYILIFIKNNFTNILSVLLFILFSFLLHTPPLPSSPTSPSAKANYYPLVIIVTPIIILFWTTFWMCFHACVYSCIKKDLLLQFFHYVFQRSNLKGANKMSIPILRDPATLLANTLIPVTSQGLYSMAALEFKVIKPLLKHKFNFFIIYIKISYNRTDWNHEIGTGTKVRMSADRGWYSWCRCC